MKFYVAYIFKNKQLVCWNDSEGEDGLGDTYFSGITEEDYRKFAKKEITFNELVDGHKYYHIWLCGGEDFYYRGIFFEVDEDFKAHQWSGIYPDKNKKAMK